MVSESTNTKPFYHELRKYRTQGLLFLLPRYCVYLKLKTKATFCSEIGDHLAGPVDLVGDQFALSM